MDQSSINQEMHVEPTSPPTVNSNAVSVLSKMLEMHEIKPEDQEEVPKGNPGSKTFGFYLDIGNNVEISKCEIQIDSETKVEAALMEALQKFKTILGEKGYEMDTSLEYYTLRLAKKNGKPKTDMPSIDLKQKFSQIKVNVSSIQVKDPSCIRAIDAVNKSVSFYSIQSQIVQDNKERKQELKTEEEIINSEKQSSCMFSFC